ncbi:uncharacterized protein TM35_000571010 [Trypanosoma theileri]|uniref:Mucin-like glycoprotein n=1 Tax=Trypanosoma theileri TaxID=67003 RepID=A0A1X0NH34_9TRYP|nr:uncharacterized protein TM35_000571010 [Trypanosoma theileri]ORC83773.1 hypothetical protein TM35_000571010 [Trypanosoma theileri]
MMMGRVMFVLAVVLCCACGYTMAAAAAVDNDSPNGRGVSRGAVEVSCGAGGALRVRPAAESEWLTCGLGSRVSACGKYADLCRQRTARTTRTSTTTTATTVNAGQPKAVMAESGRWTWEDFLVTAIHENKCSKNDSKTRIHGLNCSEWQKKSDFKNIKAKSPFSEPAKEIKDLSTEPIPTARVESDVDRMSGHETESPELEVNSVAEVAANVHDAERQNAETGPTTSTVQSENTESTAAQQSNQGTSSNTSVNAVPVDNNPSKQQSPPAVNVTGVPDSQETSSNNVSTGNSTTGADMGVSAKTETEENTSTTPANPENTTTEAPTTTPSPSSVPNAEISSNIASTVQKNKAIVDSSVSPVWMRTAAPLLIVAVFSVTVC